MEQRNQRVLLIANATSGTAFWRVKTPLELLRDLRCCDLTMLQIDELPTRDRFWLERYDVVVFHQMWSDNALILARYMKSIGKRIVLSIDDLINGYKIPLYIEGCQQYRDDGVVHNIHDMMDIADKIVVTQPHLAKELSQFYEIDESRFVLFPNMPSFNWLGRHFNIGKKKRGSEYRVGIISSISHYWKTPKAEKKDGQMLPVDDDLSIVEEAVKDLSERGLNDIRFVMPVGNNNTITDRLRKYAKVEETQMVSIRQYPQYLSGLDLDLVVVPLQRNDFNDSKSNIKLLECAALGFPVLVSDSFAYRGFIDEKYMFNDPKELAAKIVWAKSWDEKTTRGIAVENYKKYYEGTQDYYGTKLQSYWIEQNLTLVGDTFLQFSRTIGEDGIVAPKLKTNEVKKDGKKEEN